jgi:hypothetical protein
MSGKTVETQLVGGSHGAPFCGPHAGSLGGIVPLPGALYLLEQPGALVLATQVGRASTVSETLWETRSYAATRFAMP